MTFKQYLAIMIVGTLAALASWLMVLYLIDPLSAGLPSKAAFFATFSIALCGVLTIVGTLLRVFLIHKTGIVSRQVAHAFRQAIFFTSIVSGALLLSAMDYLRWWMMLLIVLFFAFLEAFFQTAGRREL